MVHDTHVHGNCGAQVNIAHKAGVINEIRSRRPNSLFVGNGDDLTTSALSSSATTALTYWRSRK